jgi:1-acyl-sn-glycerol-3-phosphate acyltransferase
MAIKFHSAKHWNWLISIVQWFNALDLAWRSRLHLYPPDLKILKTIPKNAGLILIANHADEMDIKVCIELARRSKRRFTYMMTSEAFEEGHGFAGWWLERLGCFSVERGGKDQEAMRYSVNAVRKEGETLVIFPEGEIYYLNDLIQPFKTGAVHIGLQAITEGRAKHPDWHVYLLPVAIKYRYRTTIESILNKKIWNMEKHLSIQSRYFSFQEKLIHIMARLLKSQKLLAQTKIVSEQITKLKERTEEARSDILSRMEAKYQHIPTEPKEGFINRVHKMIFFLREQLARKKHLTPETRVQLQKDLQDIKRASRMASWQPQYIDLQPSEERLAETVMKLEREIFNRKRPRPLGHRDVFMRIGSPLDLGRYLEAYKKDPSFISHQIAQELHDDVQQLIEKMTS